MRLLELECHVTACFMRNEIRAGKAYAVWERSLQNVLTVAQHYEMCLCLSSIASYLIQGGNR
jgi:hypothetical protein